MQYRSKLPYKIGKVRNFDTYEGEIVTDKNIYYFVRNDINEGEVINNDDYVMFKSKTEDTFPQGYYIKKVKLKVIDKNQG